MLEVTHGRTKNQPVAKDVRQLLLSLNLDGSLYIGYPVLATADESITVDALLVTLQHGLVAFLFDELSSVDEAYADAWHGREDRQNQLFVAVENNLRRHESLRRGRRLAIDIQTVTVVPDDGIDAPPDLDGEYCAVNGVPNVLTNFAPVPEDILKPLQAALQRVSTIRAPKRRNKISSSSSRGAAIRQIGKPDSKPR